MLSGITGSDIVHNILSSSSRYINLDLVRYDDKVMMNVPDRLNIVPSITHPDSTIVVTGRLVNRLDLVSLQYYGTPKYWWVLAYYNNFKNPFLLPHGTVMQVPSFTTLLLNNIVKS